MQLFSALKLSGRASDAIRDRYLQGTQTISNWVV